MDVFRCVATSLGHPVRIPNCSAGSFSNLQTAFGFDIGKSTRRACDSLILFMGNCKAAGTAGLDPSFKPADHTPMRDSAHTEPFRSKI